MRWSAMVDADVAEDRVVGAVLDGVYALTLTPHWSSQKAENVVLWMSWRFGDVWMVT